MQAIHDIIFHKLLIRTYDHLEFGGVVPRTFIGAIVVSMIAFPIKFVVGFFTVMAKVHFQTVCRLILGTLSWCAASNFYDGISMKFNTRVAKLTLFLIATQFHLPFYMSRPLPNTFALIVTMQAFTYWLQVNSMLLSYCSYIIMEYNLQRCVAGSTIRLFNCNDCSDRDYQM